MTVDILAPPAGAGGPVTIAGQPIGTDPTDRAARLLGIVTIGGQPVLVSVDGQVSATIDTTDGDVATADSRLLAAIEDLIEELRGLRELVTMIAS